MAFRADVERSNQNQIRNTRLDYESIYINGWSKMCVGPALCIIDDRTIEVVCGDEASETVEFLKALNLIFIKSMLSHSKITSMDDDPIINLQKGMKYFTNWLQEWLDEINANNIKKKDAAHLFLHHTTFQELNIMYDAMMGYTEQFLATFEGHYIIAQHLNQSVLESLFSYIRHLCGGYRQMNEFMYSSATSKMSLLIDVENTFAKSKNKLGNEKGNVPTDTESFFLSAPLK